MCHCALLHVGVEGGGGVIIPHCMHVLGREGGVTCSTACIGWGRGTECLCAGQSVGAGGGRVFGSCMVDVSAVYRVEGGRRWGRTPLHVLGRRGGGGMHGTSTQGM